VEYPEGSSLVIDFKGKVIAQRMTSPVITADLSPAQLAQFREKFPAWRDADPFTLNI
jgi:predicted amidohydrolase